MTCHKIARSHAFGHLRLAMFGCVWSTVTTLFRYLAVATVATVHYFQRLPVGNVGIETGGHTVSPESPGQEVSSSNGQFTIVFPT